MQKCLRETVFTNDLLKKWKEKVLGSEEDINQDLKELKRVPHDVNALQDIIFTIRQKEGEKMAQISSQDIATAFPD